MSAKSLFAAAKGQFMKNAIRIISALFCRTLAANASAQDATRPLKAFTLAGQSNMGINGLQEGKKAPQMHFRQVQVAPTLLPEFQGNVVAVQTAPFWDDDLGALQQRMERLNDGLERPAIDPGRERKGSPESDRQEVYARGSPTAVPLCRCSQDSGPDRQGTCPGDGETTDPASE